MSSKKYGVQFLKGLKQYRVPRDLESLCIQDYLIALDCPRALTVAILLKYKEYDQLSKLEFNPLDYNTIRSLRDAYSATKLLSKYSGFTRELDLDEVALKKFNEFELLCKSTNSRFRSLSADPLYKGPAVWLHNAITRKIEKILGEFSWDEFFCLPDWGPGASTLIKRREASASTKFQLEAGITRDLYSLLPLERLKEVYPLWATHLSENVKFPTFQVGNRVTTVPKDSSTNRVIAIEPGLNLFFQSSIGDMIKRRLLRYGVDLRYQSRNQQLARLGSLTSELATVDLSSASDSIAIEVVRELLPPDWFDAMDACRSHYGTQKSELIRWNKFSSMGNGFTFQLESLIFYAVASCCCEYLHISSRDVSSYGDDVIIPTPAFGLLSDIMFFYGFRINLKKSHFNSYFRESCGSHYYHGVNVKPIYLKDKLSSALSVYRLANAILRLAYLRNGNHYSKDASLYSVHHRLTHALPKALRLWIPDGVGDGGLVSDFDQALPERARNGIEGYRYVHVEETSKTRQEERLGYLLAELWRLEKRSRTDLLAEIALTHEMDSIHLESCRTILKAITDLLSSDWKGGSNKVPLTGQVRLRISKSIVQQWSGMGPWL